MIKNLFKPSDSYQEMILHYTKTDGLLAITIYVLLMFIYYYMGVIVVKKQIYLGIPISLLLVVACILFVLLRKQKLSSVNALGVAVATMGPTAAMGIVTTFGVASTGTAISTLSGATATNATLAWLGGGALAAGGGGMSLGSVFLALTGPVGWTIAGVILAGSVGSGYEFRSQGIGGN